MEREIQDLVSEGKEFFELKKKLKYNRFPSAGSPAYLVSKAWTAKYKKYILYSHIKRSTKPVLEANHCGTHHPGPISSLADLCEISDRNLVGTNSLPTFERDIVDRYLKKDTKERYHYKVLGQELWDFLHGKYGGELVKRNYVQMGPHYSTVEIYFKQIPVILI